MGSHSKAKCAPFLLQSTARAVRAVTGLHFLNDALIILLIGLRPLLGPAQCRFEISCGNYAVKQLETRSVLSAIWAIIKRLLACNPFAT